MSFDRDRLEELSAWVVTLASEQRYEDETDKIKELGLQTELLLAEYDEALEMISGFMEAWKDLKIAEAQQEQARRLWTPGK